MRYILLTQAAGIYNNVCNSFNPYRNITVGGIKHNRMNTAHNRIFLHIQSENSVHAKFKKFPYHPNCHGKCGCSCIFCYRLLLCEEQREGQICKGTDSEAEDKRCGFLKIPISPQLSWKNKTQPPPCTIGRINDEQLVKLRTMGMTEEEAESVIIDNFLN